MVSPRPGVIDLGEYAAEPDPGPGGARSGEGRPGSGWQALRQWQRHRRARIRGWAAAVLVALLAATMAGATGPSAPVLQRLWAVPDTGEDSDSFISFAADGHRLYGVAEGRLTAYRLADGRVEWATPLPADAGYAGVVLVGGLPAAILQEREPSLTVAYDPETGQERWRHPGVPDGELDGWPMLTAVTGEQYTATVVDPATGRAAGGLRLAGADVHDLLWSASVERWRAPDGGWHQVVLRRDGRLTRYDLATGEAVARVRTPHVEPPDSSTNSLQIIEGMVVVSDDAADPPAVAAYDLAGLTRRWAVSGSGWSNPCGPAVCLFQDDGPAGGVRAIDPATGRTRWSHACSVESSAGQRCDMSVRELGGQRLWMEETRWPDSEGEVGDERTTAWIAEAGTGEAITGSIGWGLYFLSGDSPLLLGRAVVPPGEDGEDQIVWLAQVDAELTGVQVLGAIRADFCEPHHPYLVCGAGGTGLVVWRIRG